MIEKKNRSRQSQLVFESSQHNTGQNAFYKRTKHILPKIHGTFLRENSSNFYAWNNQGQQQPGKHKEKR